MQFIIKKSTLNITRRHSFFSNSYIILLCILLSAGTIADAQQLPNPIRYYPLDNGQTNEIINQKNGIAHGTIVGGTDRFGNPTGAADLMLHASTNPFIETPEFFNSADIPNRRYSVTFWAKVDVGIVPPLKKNFFFAASGSVITRKRLLNLAFASGYVEKSSGNMQITRYIPSNITTDTKEFPYWLWFPMSINYCKNQWVFFVISLTPQSTRVYMKTAGEETVWATNHFPSQDLSAATFWGIGDYDNSRYNRPDYIDDFKVYADSLDINQVERLYNIEKPHGRTWGVYRLKNVKSKTYLTADYGVDARTDKDAMIRHEDRAGATCLWKINFPTSGADYIQWLGEYGNQKCLNVYWRSTFDNARVGTYGAWDDNAKWYFQRQSDGTYQIRNYLTGTWLATDNGSTAEDARVRARTSPQSDGSGSWLIEEVNLKPFDEDYYRFQNKKSGHYFSQGDLTYYTRPGIYNYFEFRAQQRTEDASGCKNIWQLKAVAHNNDQWRSYKLRSINLADQYWDWPPGWAWSNWLNAGNYLVPQSWSWDDGTLLVTGDDKNADEGQYIIWKDTQGFYRIANLKHMKFCAVENGSRASGAYIKQSGLGSDNAQWINFEKIQFHYSEGVYNKFRIKNVNTSNYLTTNSGSGFENLYGGDKTELGVFYVYKHEYPDYKHPRSVMIFQVNIEPHAKAWDLDHYYIQDNSSIGTYHIGSEDKLNQDWYIYNDSKGYLRIASAYSMKYARLVLDGGKYWLRNCCDNDNSVEGGLSQWIFEEVNPSVLPVQATNNLIAERAINNDSTQNNQFIVYPNPSNGNINISFLMDKDAVVKFDLIDLTGKVVSTQSQNILKGPQKVSLQLGAVNNSVYILKATKSTGELIGCSKIMVH